MHNSRAVSELLYRLADEREEMFLDGVVFDVGEDDGEGGVDQELLERLQEVAVEFVVGVFVQEVEGRFQVFGQVGVIRTVGCSGKGGERCRDRLDRLRDRATVVRALLVQLRRRQRLRFEENLLVNALIENVSGSRKKNAVLNWLQMTKMNRIKFFFNKKNPLASMYHNLQLSVYSSTSTNRLVEDLRCFCANGLRDERLDGLESLSPEWIRADEL